MTPGAGESELRGLAITGHDWCGAPAVRRIEGCILSGCQLRDVDWRGVQISDSRFVGCDLANGKLCAAGLRRVELVDCRMTGIDVSDSSLTDVVLLRCRADLSLWFWTSASRARFEACNFRESEFEGVVFEDVALRGCDLTEARFVRPRLSGVDLRGSSLGGVQMPPEALRGATIDVMQAVFVASLLGVRVLEE